jgi:hypothetical protein
MQTDAADVFARRRKRKRTSLTFSTAVESANIGTTAVIARYEAIAHTALYLRFIDDYFVPRNDGLNAGFRGSSVIGAP